MWNKIRSLFFSNRSTKQIVAKNTFWLIFGNIFSRLIRAGLVIYAARLLSPREWGAFNYAMSLVAFFVVFSDFGVNAVMTRESSKDPSQQEKYFSTSFLIKSMAGTIIMLFLLILYPIILPHLTASTDDFGLISVLIPIVAFSVIFDSFRDFGSALSRAWERMEVESLIQVVTNIIIVATGFIFLYYVRSARSLAWGYTIGTGVGMVVAFVPFKHYFKSLFKNLSWQAVRSMIASSWPFGLMGLIGTIMLNTDSVMIGWLRSIEDVGYYSAGQKIVGLIYTIPYFISVAFFPTMMKMMSDKERLRSVMERSLNFLSVLAIPLSVGGAVLSRQIIVLVYGSKYLAGTSTLTLLSLTYLTTFIAPIIGNMMFAFKKEMLLIKYVTLAFLGNLVFDILFIPIWGIAGSALSTLLNQIISVSYLAWLLKKEMKFTLLHSLIKPFLASLGMGLAIYAFSIFGIPLIINILLGAIIYFVLLIILKEKTTLEVFSFGKGTFKNFVGIK